MALEGNFVGICDHCGSIERAMTPWSRQDVEGCECLCHTARQGEMEKKKVRRSKKRG